MLKISQKGMLLVCVPLAFELVFVFTLWFFLHQTEQEVKREAQARRISSQTSIVVRGILDYVIGIASYGVLRTERFESQYDDAVKHLPQELEKLEDLLASQPEKQRTAHQVGENFQRGLVIANDARIKMENGEIAAATKLLPTLQHLSMDASRQLYDLAKDERSVERESPLIQQRLRENLSECLLAGIFLNVLICIAMANYFSRNITNRLRTMSENSNRLVLGQPLLPQVSGDDEIAAVDRSFHQMAGIIADTTKRERALVENAESVICSLDRDGKFVAVNSAAQSLWYYEPDSLVGRRVVDVLLQPDREPFLSALEKLSEGNAEAFPLETCIVKKDAQPSNVVWSAHWSNEEKEFVCVVHDITERKKQEDRIRFAEERARSIIENIPTGIAILSQHGTVELINPALDKMFKLSEGETSIVNRSISILFNTSNSQSELELDPESLTDTSISCQAKRTDGSCFPVEIGCYKYRTKEGFRYLMLIIDITEREKVEQLKQDFIMILSHELRTPLTTLKLFLDLITEGIYGKLSDQGLQKAASADRNITRLVKLVNDLLDFETIESGQIKIDATPSKLKPVIEKAVEASRGPASSYKVNIDCSDCVDATVLADEDRIIQVVINLVANAVKFAPKGSTVKVSAEKNGEFVEVRVTDKGPGIPDEHKAKIFERFKQVDETESKRKGGVGLGLAICKVIVEKHGGSIGVDSEVGNGSSFWFRLKLVDKNLV